jgi:hypothetical protein
VPGGGKSLFIGGKKIMTCNIGKEDRILRIVSGALLIGVAFYVAGNVGLILGVIGSIPLLTGLVGYCPVYMLFKIDTCEKKMTE